MAGSLAIGYQFFRERSVTAPSGVVHAFTGVSTGCKDRTVQPNSAPLEGWFKASLRLIKGSREPSPNGVQPPLFLDEICKNSIGYSAMI